MPKILVPVRLSQKILRDLERVQGRNRTHKIEQLLREAIARRERSRRVRYAKFVSFTVIVGTSIIFFIQLLL